MAKFQTQGQKKQQKKQQKQQQKQQKKPEQPGQKQEDKQSKKQPKKQRKEDQSGQKKKQKQKQKDSAEDSTEDQPTASTAKVKAATKAAMAAISREAERVASLAQDSMALYKSLFGAEHTKRKYGPLKKRERDLNDLLASYSAWATDKTRPHEQAALMTELSKPPSEYHQVRKHLRVATLDNLDGGGTVYLPENAASLADSDETSRYLIQFAVPGEQRLFVAMDVRKLAEEHSLGPKSISVVRQWAEEREKGLADRLHLAKALDQEFWEMVEFHHALVSQSDALVSDKVTASEMTLFETIIMPCLKHWVKKLPGYSRIAGLFSHPWMRWTHKVVSSLESAMMWMARHPIYFRMAILLIRLFRITLCLYIQINNRLIDLPNVTVRQTMGLIWQVVCRSSNHPIVRNCASLLSDISTTASTGLTWGIGEAVVAGWLSNTLNYARDMMSNVSNSLGIDTFWIQEPMKFLNIKIFGGTTQERAEEAWSQALGTLYEGGVHKDASFFIGVVAIMIFLMIADKIDGPVLQNLVDSVLLRGTLLDPTLHKFVGSPVSGTLRSMILSILKMKNDATDLLMSVVHTKNLMTTIRELYLWMADVLPCAVHYLLKFLPDFGFKTKILKYLPPCCEIPELKAYFASDSKTKDIVPLILNHETAASELEEAKQSGDAKLIAQKQDAFDGILKKMDDRYGETDEERKARVNKVGAGAVAGAAGGVAGLVGGAKAGAMAGSMILPGIGTVVGGAAGALVGAAAGAAAGGFGGYSLGGKLGDLLGFSDFRLKKIMRRRVCVVHLPRGDIEVHLYKRRRLPKQHSELRGEIQRIEKRYPDALGAQSRKYFYSVSARVLRQMYPRAVCRVGKMGILLLRSDRLPEPLRSTLAELNGSDVKGSGMPVQ